MGGESWVSVSMNTRGFNDLLGGEVGIKWPFTRPRYRQRKGTENSRPSKERLD